MRRALFAGVFSLAGVALLVSAAPARALVVAMPQPGPARAAQADAVVVGRVVALEDKDVQVQNVTYRIAVVNVTETIKGKKQEMVRVGFIPTPANVNPAIGVRPVRPGFNMQFTVGQDGLFFLSNGPEGKFYTTPGFATFVASQTNTFKKDVEDAKLAVKIGSEPVKYLKSDNGEERIFAASMLIQQYRTARPGAKLEKIDAEESKLILKALARANWQMNPGRFDPSHPYTLFSRLGLTQQDGWQIPQGRVQIQDIYKAAQEWLDKNADTYRIQKYVGGQALPGPGPGVILPGGPQIQPVNPIKIQPLPGKVQPLPGKGQPGAAGTSGRHPGAAAAGPGAAGGAGEPAGAASGAAQAGHRVNTRN